MRDKIRDFSKGDNLNGYWRLFRLRKRCRPLRPVLTFILNRMAHRHGGYIGSGAIIEDRPSLPHGLHGIYISSFAVIGAGCRIYQNVTIGEVGLKAPSIGSGCLIGAGAVVIGDIKIGNNVKIGAGAVVSTDVPDDCTVVAQPSRIIQRECENAI